MTPKWCHSTNSLPRGMLLFIHSVGTHTQKKNFNSQHVFFETTPGQHVNLQQTN